MPATLGDAIGTEPAWLQAWVTLLVAVHLPALVFVVGRDGGRWRVRLEPIAILSGFAVSTLLIGWLYQQVGYVRLLGLAHLVGWTPVYLWVLGRRREIGNASLFGRWLTVYLVVVGISLVIDFVDVIRYAVGDGELLHRWG